MSFSNLQLTANAGIARVTIDRPQKLNALDHQTISELAAVFMALRADTSVRAIVLTGSGNKAFVAGADIEELASASALEAQAMSAAGQRMMLSIEQLGKPVIAAINGFALGGGLEIAMACHLRIASEQAQMGLPEIGLGLMPGFGGTQRAVRLMGRGAALELCLLGNRIDARRAYELGLIHRIVPGAELLAEADALAARLAASAPHALRAILDAVQRASELSIEQGLEYESLGFGTLCATDDMREGTRAFLDKRKPSFSGR